MFEILLAILGIRVLVWIYHILQDKAKELQAQIPPPAPEPEPPAVVYASDIHRLLEQYNEVCKDRDQALDALRRLNVEYDKLLATMNLHLQARDPTQQQPKTLRTLKT